MIIPTFAGGKLVDKNGDTHPDYQQYQDLLNQQMQLNLSNDGMVIPAQSTATINKFADPANSNAKPDGTIWYDQEAKKFKGKENGVVKTFTLT